MKGLHFRMMPFENLGMDSLKAGSSGKYLRSLACLRSEVSFVPLSSFTSERTAHLDHSFSWESDHYKVMRPPLFWPRLIY